MGNNILLHEEPAYADSWVEAYLDQGSPTTGPRTGTGP